MFDCVKMKNREFMQCMYIGLAVFIIVGLLLFIRSAVQSKGAWVVVSLNGMEKVRYSLMEDGTYLLEGNGIDYNILKIEDGTASIREANCHNQICVRSKSISYTGETITCLPHQIQVCIEGGERAEYDTFAN